jgi:hypothetical protein
MLCSSRAGRQEGQCRKGHGMTFLQRKSTGRWLNAPLDQSASWTQIIPQSQSIFVAQPKITASEALFGFAGWLTCRNETVTLGAHHNAGCIVDLISEWMNTNRLPEPRNNVWPKNIKHPRN